MKDKKNLLSKEDLVLLEHLVKSLDEARVQLERFYENKDSENFNNTKRFIKMVQEKISEVIS